MPYKDPERAKAYRVKNREKIKAYLAKWRVDNPKKLKAHNAKWLADNREKGKAIARKSKYGLSDFEYNRMSDSQGFSCAICRRTPEEPSMKKAKTLCIDHCHTTSKVRGLLCNACNRGMGMMGDSITTLRNAIQYLLDHQ